MNYIVIEMQTTGTTTAVVTPIPVSSDPVQAEGVFLEKCAVARMSSVPVHTVVLLDQEGKIVARKSFENA